MSKLICKRWAFDLKAWKPTLPQLLTAVTSVQPEERERLIKFYFIEDFLSSMVGRLLMRKFVSECTGMSFNAVKFARDEHGKPYWVPNIPMESQIFSFNVSHQGHYVVLAGLVASNDLIDSSADFGVGVDVMQIEYKSRKPIAEFFRLMNKKFSETEWRYIKRTDYNDTEQLKAFMRHWCLKEAYVKELGVGITVDLQKISFTVDEDEELENVNKPIVSTTLRVNDEDMLNWYFEEHLLQSLHCVAIAFKNCRPPVEKFEYLKIDDLLKGTDASTADTKLVNYCKEVLNKQNRNWN